MPFGQASHLCVQALPQAAAVVQSMLLVMQLVCHWCKVNTGERKRHNLTKKQISSCLGVSQDHLAATQSWEGHKLICWEGYVLNFSRV